MSITEENFDSLQSYWAESKYHLNWDSVFILPSWLRVWWQVFASADTELYLRAVRQGDDIIGIAPLQIKDKTARFIGSVNVCDYLDFIIAPGKEKDFFNVLLDDLEKRSITHLDLRPLRPGSTVLNHLLPLARERGYEVKQGNEDVSVELDLPATWEEYLDTLDSKQRHEVRRKLRRLEASGSAAFRYIRVREDVGQLMDTFLRLFAISRTDKAEFMTSQMKAFFRELAEAMAESDLLRFGVIEVGGETAAMVMVFEYRDTMYLYNSGYDPRFASLSVGLLSKVLCLKESIARGKKKWDFLKGDEPYKYHIGGKEVPLYNCQIGMKI